jgi:hypothetical protein
VPGLLNQLVAGNLIIVGLIGPYVRYRTELSVETVNNQRLNKVRH